LQGPRRGASPPHRAPARAAGGVPRRPRGRLEPARLQVPRADEAAVRQLMAFWQLTVPTSTETSDGLTNFLWEQGALGVVEEEAPGVPPRLRDFFAESKSSSRLLAAVADSRPSLRALGFRLAGDAEVAPLLDEAWASPWKQSFPPRLVGRRLRGLPAALHGGA